MARMSAASASTAADATAASSCPHCSVLCYKLTTSSAVLKDWLIPALHVPITEELEAWLRADGLMFPRPLPDVPLLPGDPRALMSQSTSDEFVPSLSLESALSATITRLGGSVMPKLGAKAPQDALWCTDDRTLRVQSVGALLTLLKSSDLCFAELCSRRRMLASLPADAAAAEAPAELYLTLRKWAAALQRGYHLRAWISHDRIVALSERSTLENDACRMSAAECAGPIAAALVAKVQEVLNARPGQLPQHCLYAMDVHVALAAAASLAPDDTGDTEGLPHQPLGRLRVLDVTPADEVEDPVPFTWPELCGTDHPTCAHSAGAASPAAASATPSSGTLFRALEARPGVRFDKYAAHAYPDDFFHAAAAAVEARTTGGAGADGAGGGGWGDLIEQLHAQGLFTEGNGSDDSEAESEDEAS